MARSGHGIARSVAIVAGDSGASRAGTKRPPSPGTLATTASRNEARRPGSRVETSSTLSPPPGGRRGDRPGRGGSGRRSPRAARPPPARSPTAAAWAAAATAKSAGPAPERLQPSAPALPRRRLHGREARHQRRPVGPRRGDRAGSRRAVASPAWRAWTSVARFWAWATTSGSGTAGGSTARAWRWAARVLGQEEHEPEVVGPRQLPGPRVAGDQTDAAEEDRRDVVEMDRAARAGLGLGGGGEAPGVAERPAERPSIAHDGGHRRGGARAEAARDRQPLCSVRASGGSAREPAGRPLPGAPDDVLARIGGEARGERSAAAQLVGRRRRRGDEVAPRLAVERRERDAEHVEARRQVADARRAKTVTAPVAGGGPGRGRDRAFVLMA